MGKRGRSKTAKVREKKPGQKQRRKEIGGGSGRLK